jgi:hypothetical protein
MTDTTTTTDTSAKAKRETVALRDWIDANGKPVESGKESSAIGFSYTHLPTAKRINPNFNPETDTADSSAVHMHVFPQVGEPVTAELLMCGIFGGLTLAGNIVNTATNGPKGDPSMNPIPLIAERFNELTTGVWADRATGVGGVRYDKEKLAQAIATAKGETDPAPYLAKMDNKVDPKTGGVVPADTKAAISYGAFALRNAKVKDAYDALTGGGTQISAL